MKFIWFGLVLFEFLSGLVWFDLQNTKPNLFGFVLILYET